MGPVTYTLISLAITAGAQPAYLGEYRDHQSCRAAIRRIYEVKNNLDLLRDLGVDLVPIQRAIDHQLAFQRQYTCIAKSTNQGATK